MNNIERKDKLYDYLSKAGLDNAEYEEAIDNVSDTLTDLLVSLR